MATKMSHIGPSRSRGVSKMSQGCPKMCQAVVPQGPKWMLAVVKEKVRRVGEGFSTPRLVPPHVIHT